MGEAPLSSILEDHTFRQPVLDKLTRINRRVQATGWWFNMEFLKLRVSPADNRIYLPQDVASTITVHQRPNLVQRGRVIYDLSRGTDQFTVGQEFAAQLIRTVPFEDTPVLFAEAIAAETIWEFQEQYDGDSTKTRSLAQRLQLARQEAKTEHIRNRNVNLFDNSVGIQRIRRVVSAGQRGGYNTMDQGVIR